MTKELIERSRKRHEFSDAALVVTTITLVISLVIAVTTVSIGIARADALVPVADSGGGRLALAVLVTLVIAGVGGFTAAMVRDGTHPPTRD
jgi:hypothetical protein